MKQVTAVFDIGKTNKKYFLFDEDFNEIHHDYVRFDEIPDDDGFSSEDLTSIVTWMKGIIKSLLADPDYQLGKINFSTYGASLVHLDKNGRPATPFYNYLKPMDPSVLKSFFRKYGDEDEFSSVTSSPVMGFLNSGFQLFYLKYFKPDLFSKIRYTIHFPQYLSYVLTNKLHSEYTGIGCHTALWDFQKGNYHHWTEDEELTSFFPSILPSHKNYEVEMDGQKVKIGLGVHDSSSALVPYIQTSEDPFVLISTGTWSVCMNYFNETALTRDELKKDCLTFLSTTGTPIKASRLFLGQHLSNQAQRLCDYFNCDYKTYKTVEYDTSFESGRTDHFRLQFDHGLLKPERLGYQNNFNQDLSIFDSYESAYHHLIDELTDLQIASLKLAIGNTPIKTIYLDGGFSSNEVFMQMLTDKLREYNLYSSSFAKGTALGAAIIVNQAKLPKSFLTDHYQLKLHTTSPKRTVKNH